MAGCKDTSLEALNVDRHDGNEERVDKEPVRHKNYDRECTKLPDCARGEDGDHAEHCVIRDDLERVGSPGTAQSLGYSFLHWK